MAVEEIAAQHAERQVLLARRTARQLARLWRLIDPRNIAASWVDLLPQALAALGTSQATAAASSGIYVDDVLAESGAVEAVAARVNPGAFAGIASDGRALAPLLYQPAIVALTQIQQGASQRQALASGQFLLDAIGRTQIADAGRVADGVAIAARPQVRGYTRILVGKSCSRCVVLAGRWYGWNAGFRRHTRCDCRHVPTEADMSADVNTGPRAYFDSLPRAEQDQVFGKAGAEAIRSGAEIAQVVNARRGMQTASVFGRDVLVTTEGTTTRGLAGQRLRARVDGRKRAGDRYRSSVRVRLMPEQILLEANGSRDEAIRLLRLHGYIL